MNPKDLTFKVERISSGLSYSAYLNDKKIISAPSMEELIKKLDNDCSELYAAFSTL